MIRTRIRQHERGLLFKHGDFVRLLKPGLHWFPSRLISRRRAEVQTVDTLAAKFEHKLLDVLLAHGDVRDAVKVVDLKDDERALIWKDGRLAAIVGPGRHAFWRTPCQIDVEVFSVREPRLQHPRLNAVIEFAGAARWAELVRIEPHEQGLLIRDGELAGVLRPGIYVFWKQAGKIAVRTIDLREQVADVAGQEIMTADKVTLRVNLLVTHRVTDVVKAATVSADYVQTLYREAQLALRAAVGGRSLDALPGDKQAIGGELRDALRKRAAEFGVAVLGVGLRDIILPGDMKAILNQVIAAEKQAQANLIKRREETAAARSQANTAKLLAENPQLARIKELEMLQEILAGAKTTFVLGAGDVAEQVRSLVRKDQVSAAE